MAKRLFFFFQLMLLVLVAKASSAQSAMVDSPDGKIKISVYTESGNLAYSMYYDGKMVMKDNKISLKLTDGKYIGKNSPVAFHSSSIHKEHIDAPFYRTPAFDVAYRELKVAMGSDAVVFRVYNEGMAYRFVVNGRKKGCCIEDENAEFNFDSGNTVWLSYSTNEKSPMAMAYQNYYTKSTIADASDKLAFLPATVDCGNCKLTIMESDLEAYPGMFVRRVDNSLKGVFAQYPRATDFYPWRQQMYVTERDSYIATASRSRSLPWRVVAVASEDVEMPVNHLVYALASENRIGNTDWIKPGKVAWDWWNEWGLTGVDFKAGINTRTYKYYIDFASKYGLEYVVLDEGWYNPRSGDMLTVIDDINLEELVAYARERNVGIVLWTVFNVLDKQLEAACEKYSKMGIKGFKVDFLDRDDQTAVEMVYRIADAAAKHHLFLDLHGIYKPTGIERTYPNILNFESVFGMEEVKWEPKDKDMPLYDVTFPFIRMQCGFADFTQGGMRNATKKDWQPIYNNPLTQGTRCHQAAMYAVFDSPFTMLADNPTSYEREPEYTSLIASVPVVFDETRIIKGELGEYIVTARRKGSDWYVGGLTNWNARKLALSFDFLQEGSYDVHMAKDGVNADKNASDYVITSFKTGKNGTMDVELASGGGFLMCIKKAK